MDTHDEDTPEGTSGISRYSIGDMLDELQTLEIKLKQHRIEEEPVREALTECDRVRDMIYALMSGYRGDHEFEEQDEDRCFPSLQQATKMFQYLDEIGHQVNHMRFRIIRHKKMHSGYNPSSS